ncbi:Thermophilic serine proteinase precursor [compost metagenome]
MNPSRRVTRPIAFTLGLTLLAGCQMAPTGTTAPATVAPSTLAPMAAKATEWQVAKVGEDTQYLVEFTGDAIPANFAKEIEKAGGKVASLYDGAGIATVLSARPDFAQKVANLRGIQKILVDHVVYWGDRNLWCLPVDHPLRPKPGAPIPYGERQWNLQVIKAPEAWNAGATGRGVTVAVLDSGIDYTNPEFSGQIDPRSRSFIEADGPDGNVYDILDLNGHGSHVSGIIAAKADGTGVTGVAPHAKILALKVLNYRSVANFDTVIKGIYYASMNGADVINMSLGGGFAEGDPRGEELKKTMGRAVKFAFRKGSVVVSSVGNNRTNYDTTTDFRLPAMLDHNLGVSGTGPSTGTDYDSFANFYSNYGKRLVDLSAPGGGVIIKNGQLSPDGFIYSTWSTKAIPQTIEGMPTQAAPYFALAGTSMAAAHVSGAAALVVSKRGNLRTQPKKIVETLFETADDLGTTGFDAYFGEGRVNAYQAVRETKTVPGLGLILRNLISRLW